LGVESAYCNKSSPTIKNCFFTGNSVEKGNGAGIYLYSSRSKIIDCNFSANIGTSFSTQGGGVFCNQGNVVFENCVFFNNSADSGGALRFHLGSHQLFNCTITNNTSRNSGGGLHTRHGRHIIKQCYFKNNQSTVSSGGAIYCDSGIAIVNCIITENSCKNNGGGIKFDWSSIPVLVNCEITKNHAGREGGGVYFFRAKDPILAGCIVADNSSKTGGGIFVETSLSVRNCTITENSAEMGGGIFFGCGSQGSMTNSIVWANQAEQGGDIMVQSESALSRAWPRLQGGAITLSYCSVLNSTNTVFVVDGTLVWDNGNVTDNPLLTEAGHLDHGSPCIDAGDPNGNYFGKVDIDGEPRVVNGRSDIGADEFIDTAQ